MRWGGARKNQFCLLGSGISRCLVWLWRVVCRRSTIDCSSAVVCFWRGPVPWLWCSVCHLTIVGCSASFASDFKQCIVEDWRSGSRDMIPSRRFKAKQNSNLQIYQTNHAVLVLGSPGWKYQPTTTVFFLAQIAQQSGTKVKKWRSFLVWRNVDK